MKVEEVKKMWKMFCNWQTVNQGLGFEDMWNNLEPSYTPATTTRNYSNIQAIALINKRLESRIYSL